MNRLRTFSRSRRFRFCILPAAMLIIVIALMTVSHRSSVARAHEVRCQDNLQKIAQGFTKYALENDGHWARALVDVSNEIYRRNGCYMSSEEFALRRATGFSGNIFTCPGHPPPAGAGQSSYVLLVPPTKKRDLTDAASRVLMYDSPGSHGHAGIAVLFCDLHGEFIRGDFARQVLAELQSGQNPPPSLVNRKSTSRGR